MATIIVGSGSAHLQAGSLLNIRALRSDGEAGQDRVHKEAAATNGRGHKQQDCKPAQELEFPLDTWHSDGAPPGLSPRQRRSQIVAERMIPERGAYPRMYYRLLHARLG